MKLTKNRSLVFEQLKKSQDLVSVKNLKKQLPTMDTVTLYRVLDYLVSQGQIKKIVMEGESFYEYQEAPHYHAQCTECDKLLHVDCDIDQIKKMLKKERGFVSEDVQLMIRGKCAEH